MKKENNGKDVDGIKVAEMMKPDLKVTTGARKNGMVSKQLYVGF